MARAHWPLVRASHLPTHRSTIHPPTHACQVFTREHKARADRKRMLRLSAALGVATLLLLAANAGLTWGGERGPLAGAGRVGEGSARASLTPAVLLPNPPTHSPTHLPATPAVVVLSKETSVGSDGVMRLSGQPGSVVREWLQGWGTSGRRAGGRCSCRQRRRWPADQGQGPLLAGPPPHAPAPPPSSSPTHSRISAETAQATSTFHGFTPYLYLDAANITQLTDVVLPLDGGWQWFTFAGGRVEAGRRAVMRTPTGDTLTFTADRLEVREGATGATRAFAADGQPLGGNPNPGGTGASPGEPDRALGPRGGASGRVAACPAAGAGAWRLVRPCPLPAGRSEQRGDFGGMRTTIDGCPHPSVAPWLGKPAGTGSHTALADRPLRCRYPRRRPPPAQGHCSDRDDRQAGWPLTGRAGARRLHMWRGVTSHTVM